MLLKKLPKCLTPLVCKRFKASAVSSPATSDEYTEKPEYPPILDLSLAARKDRERQSWHDEVKAVPTVEAKAIKLNMPRYYGFKTVVLSDWFVPYNAIPFVQHYTRTHLMIQNRLPEFYDTINVDNALKDLKSEIEEAVLFELEGYKRTHDLREEKLDKTVVEDIISNSIVEQINRILINSMSKEFPHLSDLQVDHKPRFEAFWFVGGIAPPSNVKSFRKKFLRLERDRIDEPVDRAVQYTGQPFLNVRCKEPLKPIIPFSEAESPAFTSPILDYQPKSLGLTHTYRYGTNVPGFWPGDPHEFGLVSFHKRSQLIVRNNICKKDDDQDSLHALGMLASYSWLLGQASYQGFTTYNEVTYPLTAQTVITDGKHWSFYVFQLNTLLVNSKHVYENPRHNVCWGMDQTKLYDNITNGKLEGFNVETLKPLLQFYANKPEIRQGVEMKPYLGQTEKVVADIKDEEKRVWLEDMFKKIVSNRPRYQLPYEIYHWEKIYKIDHKTRPLERRLRPFELLQNGYQRRLDDHPPRYVPKALRPGMKKSEGRHAKTYYP